MSSKNIKVGIDIGTYQVKVVVASLVQNENKFIPKIISTGIAESKGMRNGYIINTEEVKESVAKAVSQAEKNIDFKIKEAYISVGGIGLGSITSTAQTIVGKADLEITELDLEKIESICEENIPESLTQNRKILHAIPTQYKIDGKLVLGKSPLGMKGSKLEIKMLFITCMEKHLEDFMEAINDLNIRVIDALASPIVAGEAILTKSQKMVGCVLANIGAETISIVVFENNIPVSLEVFPIGSSAITNDIALGLKVSIEEAESIKIGAMTKTSYPKKKLDEIIGARLYDMFELIENHLKKIGRNQMLPAGIFITGGGSNIGTIEDLARAVLKLPSRITTIANLEKGKVIDSTWAVAYGLCIMGFYNNKKNSGQNNLWIKKTLEWVRRFLP